MISAGVDIGSTTTKVAIIEDGALRASVITDSGNLPGRKAEEAYAAALARGRIDEDDVTVITATGYGRRLVDFGDVVMTEIKACATGVLARAGEHDVHTIIDVGGQDTKVIAIDDDGTIEDFSMNDKCAAGTGRFLEMLARRLELPYEAFVEEALKSDTMIQMNATCAVFAESEVVGLLARNVSKPDIAAAAHNAIASRIASMVRRVSRTGAYCFVGGGARNQALVKAVKEALNTDVLVPEEAQLMIAIGAAVGGERQYRKRMTTEGGTGEQ